jgi:NAD(P)-dependent dehydrogenase (short-subunit alcohol dehydrogenase family)
MASNAVALILGAGGNVGHHVGLALAAKGFKVALAARSAKQSEDTPDKIHVQSDFSSPESISKLFETVRSRLGQPSVVVYNGTTQMTSVSRSLITNIEIAAALTANDPKNPFSISLEDFQRDLNVNTTSVFAAAKEAVAGFQQLPASASPTFIYTGNMLNTATIAPLMDLGVGKSASAHMIQLASEAFTDKGFK